VYIDVELIYNNTYKFVQFTYKVPEKLVKNIQIGSIVEVLFRNKKYNAVVVNTNVEVNDKRKVNEVLKIINSLSRHQFEYLKMLSLANFLNIGILLSEFFNIKNYLKQKKVNNFKYKLQGLDSLFTNVSDKHQNVFIVPSLKECNKLYNKLDSNNISLDFYQKTGGKDELDNFLLKNNEYKNIIILSNNFNYLNINDNVIFHFYDTNNIAYKLPKLNSLNIVEAAVYKNMIFGGNYIFYNNFPTLDIFNSIDHIKNIEINNDVTYLYGNNLEECINIFINKYDVEKINPFTFSLLIKENFSEYNFSDNFESSKNDTFILFNPKIAYNNTLNSIRLISLLNQLEYCLINDINVIIISTKEHNLDDMFSINNIKKLAKKEIKDRHNYGPNINKKVYYFSTNYKFNNEKNNEIVLGPKISDNLYEYEIRLFLSSLSKELMSVDFIFNEGCPNVTMSNI